ncbi:MULTISPECIES: hypothetical protein [Streptomyces]|uniref:hypothetical protein n=1 Tax=Streptomyces TaxID=1883 RepID=UPI00017EA611|nr:hypothetical protein [Streptomyces sp. Mg1]EDX20214.1 hypothetical protein SSAG_00005 [Streptomyces sp. Mg1]
MSVVVVAVRRPEAAVEAFDALDRVEVRRLDLGDQASVHTFADEFLAIDRGIDILIHNAGGMALPRPASTRLGGAVRHQPAGPLHAHQPAVARTRSRPATRRRSALPFKKPTPEISAREVKKS